MKKRLLTLSMVGLLALGITSCSKVDSKQENGQDVIVSFKDESGKEINYTADDLLNQYATTETGVKAYYNAIYDILIRKDQSMTQTMKMDVEKEMDDFVNKCKSTASTNGTTYNAELSKALEAEGVKDLGELRELKELQIQKAEYEKEFYSDEQMEQFTKNFIEEKAPYHIRHILVKTDDVEGSSVYEKEISKDESKKIASIVDRLASGKESFGDIAYDASDDTSNALYGSVGIMQTDTAFVSEFKYSIYYYDALLAGEATGKTQAQVLDMLQIPETINLGTSTLDTKTILNESVGSVPYSAVKMFDDYAETTKTVDNKTYTDEIVTGQVRHEIDSHYYPRNVLFNTYFNNHGLTFITDEGFEGETNANWVEPTAELKAILGDTFDHKILTDNGNPILVTYNPSTGLHFMIIEKSPIRQKYDSYTDYSEDKAGKEVELKTLEEELLHYYSLDVPSGSDNVTNDNRYVTYIKSNRTGYDSRATELKNFIKSYDPHMDYKIFESLILRDGEVRKDVTIDQKILDSIFDYMKDQRANGEYTTEQANISSWTKYLQLLDFQGVQKAAKQLDFNETKLYFTDTKGL